MAGAWLTQYVFGRAKKEFDARRETSADCMASRRKSTKRKRRDKRRRTARIGDRLCRFREFTFALYDAPVKHKHNPEIQELAEQAADALSQGDGVAAERLLKEALAVEPSANDLQNNLCAAYSIQGRLDEAEALTREIHQRDPHYFFGRANLANFYIIEGDLEQAAQLIKPLLNQRRLHVTEFSALAGACIHLDSAMGQVDLARSWLKTWMDAVPDHPAQAYWRRKLASTPLAWLRRALRSGLRSSRDTEKDE